MTIWISIPTSSVSKVNNTANEEKKADPWYQRIYSAFDWDIREDHDDHNRRVPIEMDAETEDIAANAIKKSIASLYLSENVSIDFLIDCRSSAAIGGSAPTYKLAAKAGLRKIIPFSLTGQAGSEVGQAINYLQNMELSKSGVVVVSAIQRIVPPDTRFSSKYFPLGDAVAVVCVSASPIHPNINFKVLTTLSYQAEKLTDKDLECILERLRNDKHIDIEAIRWFILQNIDNNFPKVINKLLPNVVRYQRHKYKEIDFGCADVLVSVHDILKKDPCDLQGTGLLWFKGRFGANVILVVCTNIEG